MVYVLWTPPSFNGMDCNPSGDGTAGDYQCETVISAHDLSSSVTPTTWWVSPPHDMGGSMEVGYPTMALMGSPEGTTRLALGEGTLLGVTHDFAEQQTGFSDSAVSLTPAQGTTGGLRRSGSRLLWLSDDGQYTSESLSLSLYPMTCGEDI